MKRKSSDEDETLSTRPSKRRRLNEESPTQQSSSSGDDNRDEQTEIISPLADITNTGNKISPRPAQLITRQMEKKRILLQTKQKKITLTDDEDNIIHEEQEEDDEEFDDENEIEIARGLEDENGNKHHDIDLLDEDEFDPFDTSEQDQSTKRKSSIIEHQSIAEQPFEELEISQTLLGQRQDVNASDDENQTMNMSLQLSIHDSDIQNISPPSNDIIPSLSSIMIETSDKSDKSEQEVIDRTIELEEDEKAIELLDEDVNLPTQQSQEDDIIMQPKKKTYSMRKQKTRRLEVVETSKIQEIEDVAMPDKQREDIMDEYEFLTPIRRELKETLNRSLLRPTTRSRRTKRVRPRILPSEVQLLEQDELEREREKERETRERRRRQRDRIRERERTQRPIRGRTWSLMDRFNKDRMREIEAEIEQDLDIDAFDGDSSIINEEDEMREMILRQSGLSQQWEDEQRQRKKKRRAIRRRLARHTRKRTQTQRTRKPRTLPKKPQAVKIDARIKEKEDALADFWRDIDKKFEDDEENEDIESDNGQVITSGRRPLTPPRIEKHLERRYRKQYENATGELVELGKRKGKRVRFCKEKLEVMNDEQEQRYDMDMNNSLYSVTPDASPVPVIGEDVRDSQDQEMDIEILDDTAIMRQDLNISMDQMSIQSLPPMSSPSASIISAISGVSSIHRLESVEEGEDESMSSSTEKDKEKRSDEESVLTLTGVGIDIEMESGKEQDKEEDEYGSVVSGDLLPSIVSSLPTILEVTDPVDMESVADPFDTRNEQVNDGIISDNIESGSSRSNSIAD